jgi:hypothetical protein
MTNIITGYLAREILKTGSATVLVLYVILVSNSPILPMVTFRDRPYGR